MAADSLIDRYIATFSAQVVLRHDRSELVDEIADHLLCAAERLQSRGLDRDTAERRALAALGEPRLVASLLTTTPSKGTIMSYFLARYVWAFSILAILAWLAAGISSLWGFTELFGWTQGEYFVSAVLLGLACLSTTAVLVGANLRLVGRFDASTGWITALAAAAGLFCAAGLAWVIGLWVPLLTIAVAWTLKRVIRTQAGTRPARIVMRTAVGILGFVAVAVTVVGLVAPVNADWATLGLVGLVTVTLIAAVVELAVRPAPRSAISTEATA